MRRLPLLRMGLPIRGSSVRRLRRQNDRVQLLRRLVSTGKNPACVDSCVMRVLKFGELEELRAKYGTVNAIAPLPEAKLTNPSVVFTPHRHARLSGEGAGLDVTVDKRGAK